MSESTSSALHAARALARDLALPRSRATVFAWRDEAGERIVIALDRRLQRDRWSIPTSFRGFPVEIQDEVGAIVTLPQN